MHTSLSVQVRLQRAVFLALCASFLVVGAQNQPPVVSAGDDATYGSKDVVFLMGDASDDSTAFESLVFTWSQASGPVQAQIVSLHGATTIVRFTTSGVYVFVLTATDGKLTATDSVRITIREALPFVILKPANNEQVEINKPYVIRWQMDPSIPASIFYSLNDGLTWVLANAGAETDSFTWTVDAGFAPNTRALIKVEEYQNPPNHCVENVSILLVDHPPQRVLSAIRASGQNLPQLIVDKSGRLTVEGSGSRSITRLTLSDARGVVLFSRTVQAGNAGSLPPSLRTKTFFLYRVMAGVTPVQTGRLLMAGR